MSRRSGFTLIEVLVTLGVIAITVRLTVPMITNFVASNTITSVSNGLVTDLALARSEAIRRGTTISICPSTSGTGCTTSAWTGGRLIFVDVNASGTFDSGDTVVKISKGLSNSNVSFSMTGFSGNSYAQYTSTGTSGVGAGSFMRS